MKRFFLEFDVTHPELSPGIGGWYNHLIGASDEHHIGGSCYCGNSLKTMKAYISKIRKEYAELEPHDFGYMIMKLPTNRMGMLDVSIMNADLERN